MYNYYYSFIQGYINNPFAAQLRNNGSEYVGLSLNIPIFNKFNVRNQIKLADINHSSAKLSLLEIKRSLYKEIERLSLDIMSLYERYISAGIHVSAMKKVLESERKKYEMQKTSLYRYNEVMQTLEQAESDMLQAKYEYLFKMKIMNFYNGQSIEFDYID